MQKKNDLTISQASPKISVLLPVYNGAAYLSEAIKSILAQTYKNFELIIINDGSTDESETVIRQFNDTRILYYTQRNQGLAATLNRAITIANGKYLARQDQDDISLPQRFEKQIAFLEEHPDYGIVGTWAEIRGNDQDMLRAHKHPTESLILKFELLFNNPFVHSSMMIRKSVFEKVALYSTDKSRQPPEDYELWSRVARKFEVANIPEILHIYREVPSSMSREGLNPFLNRVMNISAENIASITGRKLQDKNINDCIALVHGDHQRLSPKPSFQGITYLLYEVADKISDSHNAPRNILRDRACELLQTIKFPCLNHRYGKIFGRVMKRLFRLKN